MICRGQRCQSARHKHGDYLIMKAVCCCSPGCELPARRRHREHRLWDAGKGWAPTCCGGSEGRQGKRAHRCHPPAADLSQQGREAGQKAVGNHSSSSTAHGERSRSSPMAMGSWMSLQGEQRAGGVGSWAVLILKLGRVLVSCIKMSQARPFEPHYLHTHTHNDVCMAIPTYTPLLTLRRHGHLKVCITRCSCCTSAPRTLHTTGPLLLHAHPWEFTKFHNGAGCFQQRHRLKPRLAVIQAAVSGTAVRPANLIKPQPRGWKGPKGITRAISSRP